MALSALSRTNDEQYNKEIEKRKTKIAQRDGFLYDFFLFGSIASSEFGVFWFSAGFEEAADGLKIVN